MTRHRLTIGREEAGRKLHRFLRAALHGLPMSRIFKALRIGEITVNGSRKEHQYSLKAGDIVESQFPFQTQSEESERPCAQASIAILYQDESVLVVNKPAGLAMHPGTGVSRSLTDMVSRPGGGTAAGYRPSPVHRLDRGTSGVVIIAKTLASHQHLA
ncbi:MAG: pseudouridine synthase, partial [bacterium]